MLLVQKVDLMSAGFRKPLHETIPETILIPGGRSKKYITRDVITNYVKVLL